MRPATAILALCALLGSAARADEAARRTPVVRAVERAGPAVVNISTERVVVQTLRDPFFDPFFEDFFGRVSPPERQVKTTSLGSGVPIDPDGYLLTNEHVIRKASKIHVTLADGKALEAILIASDRAADLALCRVDAGKPLPWISVDGRSGLLIGEPAIALGNPFGLENSVTVGVVSAKDRSLLSDGRVAYKDLVQTDASINPGNSGGPLLNIEGELIGINTAIYSEAQGIGFAIPVSRARRALADMLDPRRLKGAGWTGLDPVFGEEGLAVDAAAPGSPAARAGIRAGDRIASVGGKPASGFFPCLRALGALRPGDPLALRVLRDGKPLEMTLKAAAAPTPSVDQRLKARLGISAQALAPDLAERLGLQVDSGCLVGEVAPGGSAARAGLAPGDVIVRAGRQTFRDPEGLMAALEEGSGETTLQIVRGRRVYAAAVTLEVP